ncbi:MAG: four helix bundle protein [Bacteroidota bacterium]
MANENGNNSLSGHAVQFAKAIRDFGKVLPMTVSNVEDLKSLIRSSGNIGALIIDAEQTRNRNEFVQKMTASVKETRQTHYWLSLVDTQGAGELEMRRQKLQQAAEELANVAMKYIQRSQA